MKKYAELNKTSNYNRITCFLSKLIVKLEGINSVFIAAGSNSGIYNLVNFYNRQYSFTFGMK